MTIHPQKPPSYPSPRRLLLVIAACIPLAIGAHYALDHFLGLLGLPRHHEEILEGVLLVLIISVPLFFLFIRYFRALQAVHQFQLQSSHGREAELRQANRSLRILSQCNQILVHSQTEAELLTEMCRAIVEIGNYRMAWIGFAENDPGQTVRPAASWGDHGGYLQKLRVSWGPDEWGRGITGRAIRGGAPIMASNIHSEPGTAPWLKEAAEAGFTSAIAIPLLEENGGAFGILHIFAGEPAAFAMADAEMFRELAADIAFGLRSLRTEQDRRRHFEENRKLVRAVEQSASGVLITDPAGAIEYVNPAFTEITGYTLEEVKGKTPRVLKSGKQPLEFYRDLWNTILSGEPYRAEVINKKKDGSEYTAGVTIAPVLDEKGAVTHFVGIQADITEFVETRRQIERYTARLRKLLQLDRDISASLDPDEVFRHVVLAAAELLQVDFAVLFTAEDGQLVYQADHGGWARLRNSTKLHPDGGSYTVLRTGRPYYTEDVSPSFLPEVRDWAAAEGIRTFLGVPLKQGEATIGVLAAVCRGTRKLTDEDIELLSLLANHAAVAIEKARLIQDAQKGLEFLRTVLDSSGEPIDVTDPEGRVMMWNPAAEVLFGYPAKEIIGKTAQALIVPEDRRLQRDQFIAKTLQGERVSYETERCKKDGTRIPVRITSSPIRDAGGNMVARTAIFQDLTEQKRAEREREAFIGRLKALNNLTARISSSLDIGEVLRHVVRAAADLYNADYAVLFTAENGKLVYRADHGGWVQARGSVEPHPLGGAYAVYQTGRPSCVEEISANSAWGSIPWVAAQGIKSYLGVPLKQKEKVVGVIGTLYRTARKFTDQDIELLALLANQAATAIENAGLHQEVQEGFEFFRSVLASSVDAILTFNPQSRITSWNHAAEAMFGYSSEEAIGKTTDETILTETDKAARDAAVAVVMRGGYHVRETFRRRKDGTLIPVRLTASPVRDAGGKVVARTVVFQDLTLRKAAEREREAFIGRLKALNTLISQISSSLKVEDVLSFVARSAAEVLDIPYTVISLIEGEELIVKADVGGWTASVGSRHIPLDRSASGLVARSGEPLYIREVLDDPDFLYKEWAREREIGSYMGIPLKVQGRTIGVLSGLTTGVRKFTEEEIDLASTLANGAATAVANAQAHSQLQDAFQKLQQSQTMLIRAEKLSSIGTLTAGAAHEILNPANIIGLHAQRLMWENEEKSGPHQSAQVILRNVDRISRICEDLRRFSRDEAPKQEPFDPDDALRQCIRPLESEFRLGSVEVSYRLAAKAPTVLGDKNQIQQVFFNLIRNAMDAMPEGGTLTVGSREIAEGGRKWWETRVSDTGTGIPAGELSRIFDPFFTTKSEDKGTGLGLSVSYGIVESHGGRIWAENNPEKGATFFVWLPVKEEENEEAASAHPDRR